MTKEQLIDIFARFILENSAGDKHFYPKKDVEFRGHKVFSIYYTKLYDDYKIHAEAEPNPKEEEMDEDYFYHFKDLSFSEISMLYLACTIRK